MMRENDATKKGGSESKASPNKSKQGKAKQDKAKQMRNKTRNAKKTQRNGYGSGPNGAEETRACPTTSALKLMKQHETLGTGVD